MHVVVVGGGVSGLGSALVLARQGHDVTVVERDDTPMPTTADEAFATIRSALLSYPEAEVIEWAGAAYESDFDLLVPATTEAYTFYTVSDDGARLWINGTLVLDHWARRCATERAAAGQRSPAQLRAGRAAARRTPSPGRCRARQR